LYLLDLQAGKLPDYSFTVEKKSEISDQRIEVSD